MTANPLATFLSATGVAQNAAAIPVAVSPENPFPVVLTSGGGGGAVLDDFVAGDAQSNTVVAWNNSAADPDLLSAAAGFAFDEVTGLWYRNRNAVWGLNANLRSGFVASLTGPGTFDTLIAAPGAGLRLYITGFQTTVPAGGAGIATFTIRDSTPTTFGVYTTGVQGASNSPQINNVTFGAPLRLAANTAFQIESSVAAHRASAQGFVGV